MASDQELQVVRNDAAVAFILDSSKRILLQKKDEGYPWRYNHYGELGFPRGQD